MRLKILLLSILLLFVSFAPLVAQEKDVPTVLRERFAVAVERFDALNDELGSVYEFQHDVFTEEEWNVLYLRALYVQGEFKLPRIAMCKALSQGVYCEEAAQGLKIIERELEKLSKAAQKARDAKERGLKSV